MNIEEGKFRSEAEMVDAIKRLIEKQGWAWLERSTGHVEIYRAVGSQGDMERKIFSSPIAGVRWGMAIAEVLSE